MSEQGTAFVMDLTRLKTFNCVQKYVQLMGQEYLFYGLEKLYEDFRNSMYAAWTPAELRSAIPSVETHKWHYFTMFPLPINQFLFATSPSWQSNKTGTMFQWSGSKPPVREDLQTDYKRYRQAVFASYRRFRQRSELTHKLKMVRTLMCFST